MKLSLVAQKKEKSTDERISRFREQLFSIGDVRVETLTRSIAIKIRLYFEIPTAHLASARKTLASSQEEENKRRCVTSNTSRIHFESTDAS